MSEHTCQKCGRPVDADKPCPNCLLQLAAGQLSDISGSLSDDESQMNVPRMSENGPDIETIRGA